MSARVAPSETAEQREQRLRARVERAEFDQMYPTHVLISGSDMPFGDMLAFALKWVVAISLALVIIDVPIAVILYFVLR